jgi:hypothetical protein
MKQAGLILIATIFLGTQASASGCSDMAAFNTQINKFLKTAAITDNLKADVKRLASECEAMHNEGMTVSSINSCGDALKLTMVN